MGLIRVGRAFLSLIIAFLGLDLFVNLASYYNIRTAVSEIENIRNVVESKNPNVEFARAAYLANAGEHIRALLIYQRLATEVTGDLQASARYNLSNLLVKESMRAIHPNESQPTLELAKQMYRDLLKKNPEFWDARYNLELVLRLAPDNSSSVDDFSEHIVSVKTEREISGADRGLP